LPEKVPGKETTALQKQNQRQEDHQGIKILKMSAVPKPKWHWLSSLIYNSGNNPQTLFSG
jgi:hypothetical protein